MDSGAGLPALPCGLSPDPAPRPSPAGSARRCLTRQLQLQKPLRSLPGTTQAPLPAVPTQGAVGRGAERGRGRLRLDRAGAKGEGCGGGGGPITASRGTRPLSGLSGTRARRSQSSPRVLGGEAGGVLAHGLPSCLTRRLTAPPKLGTPLAPEERGPSVGTHLPHPRPSPPLSTAVTTQSADRSAAKLSLSARWAHPLCDLGPQLRPHTLHPAPLKLQDPKRHKQDGAQAPVPPVVTSSLPHRQSLTGPFPTGGSGPGVTARTSPHLCPGVPAAGPRGHTHPSQALRGLPPGVQGPLWSPPTVRRKRGERGALQSLGTPPAASPQLSTQERRHSSASARGTPGTVCPTQHLGK